MSVVQHFCIGTARIIKDKETEEGNQRKDNILLLLLKKVGSARLEESDVHPISPKTPALQYQPIDRNKTKGKIVEDYSRDRAAKEVNWQFN